MDIKEIVSFYINESSGMMDVTFKTFKDDEDEVRIDQIDMEEIGKFGYDFTNKEEDIMFDDEDEDNDIFSEFEDDLNSVDEEELISFLNEYYLLYPNRIPETTIY